MRNKKTSRRFMRAIQNAVIEACERRVMMSVYTVNTTSDAANPGAGLLTLREAVVAANLNSNPGTNTIDFSPTVFSPGSLHTITLQQGELSLTSSTNIQGPGQAVLAIDGNKTSRVLQIAGGVTVSISGLTITDGEVTGTQPSIGGGILNAGTLNLTNVKVSNNTAYGGDGTAFNSSGGGIYSSGSLTLTDSVVTGNASQGGSKYNGMGASGIAGGIYSSGPLTIAGSTISANGAYGGHEPSNMEGGGGPAEGGAIYATNSLTLSSTVVTGNNALAGSGTQQPGSEDSGSSAVGGGIWISGSSTLTNDTITGNYVDGGSASGGSGNAGSAKGGAIFSTNSMSIAASTISGNGATGGNGPFDDNGPGGNADGGAIVDQGPLTISGSTVSNNMARGGGGQPLASEVGASAYGGGIEAGSSLSITSSNISGNTAEADQGGPGGATYSGPGGVGQGGGIITGGTAVISDSTMADNIATGGAGQASYGDSTIAGGNGGQGVGAAIYNRGALTITDSTLSSNAAQGGGGGRSDSNGGSGGDGSGGAIYSSGTLSLHDSTVSGNTVAGGAGGLTNTQNGYSNGNDGNALGAGITISSGDALFNNTIIAGNTANGSTENDVQGTANASSGSNLVGAGSGGLTNNVNGNIVGVSNPGLSPLGNYGGPTQTMLPMFNSPAVDTGNNSLIPPGVTTDQRGYARIAGARVDIGADELQYGVVSGTVFNDLNGDGIRQSGEPGLAGVTVYADLSIDGGFEPTTVTDSNGNYSLTVPEGAVIIRQKLPSGNRQSDPVGGAGEHVTVTPAGLNGVLFGDTTRLYVAGSVLLNGVGQGGVVVYADLNNDGKFETNENNKTTLSDGSFAFVSLAPGSYTFRIVVPNGDTETYPINNGGIGVNLGSGGEDIYVNFTLASQTVKPLSGTVIGTSGSYNNQGNTAAKAFDGNLNTYFDAPTASGSWAGLDFGSAKVITSISFAPRSGWANRMVGGVFQASNSSTFVSGAVNLYTVSSTPVTGSLTTVSISNSSAYRYVRYIGPNTGYCNIAEAQFFGTTPASPNKLAGTPIGTSGSYASQGNTIAKAFDGNLSTFFDAPDASGDWLGLDLGSAKIVTQVDYAPRPGWTGRMVGGEIQASNSADFSSGVATIYTITSTPSAGVFSTQPITNSSAYRYYRYLGPANSYCNIAELEFDG